MSISHNSCVSWEFEPMYPFKYFLDHTNSVAHWFAAVIEIEAQKPVCCRLKRSPFTNNEVNYWPDGREVSLDWFNIKTSIQHYITKCSCIRQWIAIYRPVTQVLDENINIPRGTADEGFILTNALQLDIGIFLIPIELVQTITDHDHPPK